MTFTKVESEHPLGTIIIWKQHVWFWKIELSETVEVNCSKSFSTFEDAEKIANAWADKLYEQVLYW